MSTLGDFPLAATIDFHFTTRRFTTGAPFTLAGPPVVAAYEDNGDTEITAGIAVSADFDGRTGLNHVRVVATTANGYEAGKSYSLVITTGTVDSVSVVGEVIGYFTLERSAVDHLFKRDLSAITGEAARSLLNAVRAIRNKVTRSGGTITVTKEDDSTSAWTASITTDAAAVPITVVDPS